MVKKSGWHGETHRHSMAKKGIRTGFNPILITDYMGRTYLQSNGIVYTPSEKTVRNIESQLRSLKSCGEITEDSSALEIMQEGQVPDEEENSLAIMQDAQLDTVTQLDEEPEENPDEESEEEEVEPLNYNANYNSEYTIPEEETEIEEEGGVGVGGFLKKVSDTGKKVYDIAKKFFTKDASEVNPTKKASDIAGNKTPRKTDLAEYNSVTPDMYQSIDTDQIKLVVENKKEFISFTNDLEHDIDLLGVAFKQARNTFNTEESKDSKLLSNDMKSARDKLKSEIEMVKSSGFDKTIMNKKISDFKANYDYEMRSLKNEITAKKMQNSADLKYINDLRGDLDKLHRQLDKRVRMMTASGQKK